MFVEILLAIADPAKAALEWQARSLGWRSWEQRAACPFEGLVGRHLRSSK
jgi:hypothetical protein